MDIELPTLILRHLVKSDDYSRRVIPFLKTEYFSDVHLLAFKEICAYVSKYGSLPTKDSLVLEVAESPRLNEDNYPRFESMVNKIYDTTHALNDMQWMLDKTESWCKKQALQNAILTSVDIMKGEHKTLTEGAMPQLFQEALAVTFDSSIGHDYIEDFEHRYDFYQRKEEKLPFDVDVFNDITAGGLSRKTLNVLMASTGVGKSLIMCHCAAAHLAMGYNVLYITMEMAEERIAERIDANLMDVDLGAIRSMTKEAFTQKMGKIQSKTQGNLMIKEYPTGSANVNHFRAVINEYQLKKKFKPDVIYLDYLNICASSRIRNAGAGDSYALVKAIAEEVRGLAMEQNVPIVTATQTNRGGYQNSDIDLGDVAESFGLPQTADFMLGVMQTEEMEKMGYYGCKQLKNRYDDKGKKPKFAIGVEKGKMRIFELDPTMTMETGEPTPVMDAGDIASKTGDYSDFSFED